MADEPTHNHTCGCAHTEESVGLARRRVLAGVAAAGAASIAGGAAPAATEAAEAAYADSENLALPQVDMYITSGCTALVVTDPQIDFLSEAGVTSGVAGESVTEQGTVDNMEVMGWMAPARTGVAMRHDAGVHVCLQEEPPHAR